MSQHKWFTLSGMVSKFSARAALYCAKHEYQPEIVVFASLVHGLTEIFGARKGFSLFKKSIQKQIRSSHARTRKQKITR